MSAMRCSGCRVEVGGQHLPSCPRQGIVTAASDYRDRHGMSEREQKIRINCSGEHFDVSALDVLYLLGVIDVIRGDRTRLAEQRDELQSKLEAKVSA
jgi:hypothetical protein